MRLEIHQQFAKTGLQIKSPQMKIDQKPDQFELQQVPGQLKINSKPAQVKIDMNKARADLNYRNHKLYGKKIVQEARQTALKGIKRRSQEGDQLAAIEKNNKPLIAQAKKSLKDKKKEIGLKWKRGAEIKVKPGKQKIKYESPDLDGIKLDVESSWPETDLKWGKVETYLKQKAKLDTQVIDRKL
ncbi:hypothetical protein JCM16358_19170 [Halanaerocella petrolearia]